MVAMPQLDGWVWGVIGILIAVLGLAIVFGMTQWWRRPQNETTEQLRDEATRRGYEDR
jgi:hypothetical protein